MLHKCYGESRHYNTDHRHEFDQNVERRTTSILERIANGIAYNAGFMGKRALTAKGALFDILLSIISSATGISHEYGQGKAASQSAYQQSEHAGNTQHAAYDDRDKDGQNGWDNHLVLCSLR